MVLAVALGVVSAACGPQAPRGLVDRPRVFYRSLNVDPASLVATPGGRFESTVTPSGDYYGVGIAAGPSNPIVHWYADGAGGRRDVLNTLTVDSSGHVIRRRKLREVLTGDFGSIYLDTIGYYGGDVERPTVMMTTHPGAGGIDHEAPAPGSPWPPGRPPEFVGLVRVLQEPQGRRIVTADYDARGELLAILVSDVRDEQVASELDDPAGGADLAARARSYGLPPTVPTGGQPPSPELFAPLATPTELDAVSYFADRGRQVGQWTWSSGGPAQATGLTFRQTAEDAVLEPLESPPN